MRIALVCPYAWDAPGGVQVHVRELGEHMSGRGHDVVVLTPSREAPIRRGVWSVGRSIQVPYNRSAAPISPWPSTARRTHAALRRFRPDVVHAHEPLTPSASMFAVRSAISPVVATFHSAADRALLFDAAAPVLRRIARGIAVRIAVSRAAASFAQRRIGNGFAIVPNGVDVERFEIARACDGLPPGRRVLFVGRLDRRKGFPTAVAAFERLAERWDDLWLVVAGDGPDRTAIERLPDSARDRILMLGSVRNEDLPAYEASADLLMAPSVGGESFGLVLVEALAAGLPVVASDIPGYDEVVRDGTDGLLVPPRDPVALADAAARVLTDRPLARRLAQSGRDRARMFSWQRVCDLLEERYRQAVSSAGR